MCTRRDMPAADQQAIVAYWDTLGLDGRVELIFGTSPLMQLSSVAKPD